MPIIALFLSLFVARSAQAEYIVDGKVEGWFCSGFVFEKCSLKEIEALSDKEDGELFELKSSFSRVDEYNSVKERCWLNNERIGYHAFSQQENGEWEHLGEPDNITFRCKSNN